MDLGLLLNNQFIAENITKFLTSTEISKLNLFHKTFMIHRFDLNNNTKQFVIRYKQRIQNLTAHYKKNSNLISIMKIDHIQIYDYDKKLEQLLRSSLINLHKIDIICPITLDNLCKIATSNAKVLSCVAHSVESNDASSPRNIYFLNLESLSMKINVKHSLRIYGDHIKECLIEQVHCYSRQFVTLYMPTCISMEINYDSIISISFADNIKFLRSSLDVLFSCLNVEVLYLTDDMYNATLDLSKFIHITTLYIANNVNIVAYPPNLKKVILTSIDFEYWQNFKDYELYCITNKKSRHYTAISYDTFDTMLEMDKFRFLK